MTSNQLAYWRNEETRRSNLANEQLTAIQHQLRDKEIEVNKLLKEAEIEQRKQEDTLKLAQLLSEYGYMDWSQLPYDVRVNFYDYLGVKEKDLPDENDDSRSPRIFKEVWDFIKETANAVGNAAKGIGALW